MNRSTCLTIAATLLLALPAGATTRETSLVHARSFANYPWHVSSNNLKASCSAAYDSLYSVGDYVGLPYDWGGYMSLAEFSTQIAQGYGAGSQSSDGVLACTAGLDCSGFVSQCWEVGHFATATLAQTSTAIDVSAMLPADVFNMAGYHVALFARLLASGEPLLYEAIGYNVRVNSTGGWSHVDGYTPRRENGMTGTTDTDPVGTITKPIVIGSLPYSDSRDTKTSSSKALDACGAAPTIDQKGPEFVYRVDITSPGTLTASVTDDATTDIDVQIYTQLNYPGCVARNDKTATLAVGCGTYYIVADTFKTSAGAYTLSVSHAPSGKACNEVAGPPAFNPGGAIGEPCQNPNDSTLPFCNPNLGGDVCIYTSSASMCSRPCSDVSDCTDLTGACCEEIAPGEKYCLAGSFCSGGGGTVTPLDGGSVGDPSGEDMTAAGSTGNDGGSTSAPDLKKPSTGKDAGTGSDLGGGDPGTGGDDLGTETIKTAGDVGGCQAVPTDGASALASLAMLAVAFRVRRPARRRLRA